MSSRLPLSPRLPPSSSPSSRLAGWVDKWEAGYPTHLTPLLLLPLRQVWVGRWVGGQQVTPLPTPSLLLPLRQAWLGRWVGGWVGSFERDCKHLSSLPGAVHQGDGSKEGRKEGMEG